MIVDHIGNWRRYGFGPAWEETMRWLENYAPGGSGSLADLTDGTHPLTDGFVSVATLTSRPLSGSLYECHKRFCDVQMVVEGQEWLFNAATTGLSLDGPFDDQRDVGFFQPAPAEVSRVTLSPGTFALLFPWDAHLPAITVDGVPAPCASAWAKFPSRRCAFHKTTCNANDFRANLRPSRGKVWPVLRDSPCFTLK